MPMNRSTFNKSVVPGLFAMVKSGFKLKSKQAIWKQLCQQKTSNRAYEESAYFAGLGLPVVKPEGTVITYDDFVQGPTKRWTHKTYGLGCRITEELIEDSLYNGVPTEMGQMATELGTTYAELWEVLTHNVINNGTSTTYHTVGDGLALFSASHTALRGGTWSNLLSPAADLSATSLQTAIDNFTTTKDDTGKYQVIQPKQILVAPQNAWKTYELLESGYDPESANNAINSIKKWGLTPLISPYLTDTDAFTLISNPPTAVSGIIAFMRRPVKVANDGDFETGDLKIKATARFSIECNRPDNLYHSAGA